MKNSTEIDIDQSFKNIDKIINELSNDKTSIEKSIKLYEDGINLIKNLKKSINKVEKKIEVLSEE